MDGGFFGLTRGEVLDLIFLYLIISCLIEKVLNFEAPSRQPIYECLKESNKNPMDTLLIVPRRNVSKMRSTDSNR